MDELQDYQLRLGTHDDAAIITDLVQAAYAKWVPIIGRNPLLMDVDYTGALKIHRFDLPFKDESLAALVETRAAPDCLFLENLCVSPHYQRQGIGQILLARVEDIARKADRDLIKLDTNKLFAGNVELYRRAGYTVDWKKPVIGGVHVRMSKALNLL